MFISTLILIILVPFIILPLALETFFSFDELIEMGISIGNPEAITFLPIIVDLPKAQCSEHTCQVWNVTEQVMG